jgi:diguanylate cyclase (GGDEF)-like protein
LEQEDAIPRVGSLARLGRQRDFSLPRFRRALALASRHARREEILRHLFAEWVSIPMSDSEAAAAWNEIEALFPRMREKLGEPLSLQTVLLHHFHTRRGKLKDPRLLTARDLSLLKVSALTDPLTGLYNRRFLMDHLAREISRSERAEGILSLMLLDLKDFKAVNDQYGHSVGDKVLQRTARAVRESLRSVDAGCRWGGDEFIVVLPGTNFLFAVSIAERIRRRIAAVSVPHPAAPKIEVGVHYGIATYPTDGKTAEFVLKVADLRLYQCREQANFPGSERRNYPRFSPAETSIRLIQNGSPSPAPGGTTWTAPVMDVSYGGIALRAPEPQKWPRRWTGEIFRRLNSERHAVRLRALNWVPLPDGGVRVGCSYV